jgi:hypothetical protein
MSGLSLQDQRTSLGRQSQCSVDLDPEARLVNDTLVKCIATHKGPWLVLTFSNDQNTVEFLPALSIRGEFYSFKYM